MRIAVDAMGAEKGIGIVVEGAIRAIQEAPEIEIILVGDKDKIEEETRLSHLKEIPFSMVHAPQIVEMTDSATVSLKEKKNSSIAVALNLLNQKKAEALVSAGNTGAVMTASLFKLGKLKGVKRPCLAAVFPTLNGKKVVLLDVGANVDCRPYYLFQFAMMGSTYAYKVLRIRSPRVGLLSIGEEENKGNDLVLQAFKLMKESSLNFVGNIEGRDITSGKVQVVVCDGFIGNIILKFAEGFAKTVLSLLNERARSSLPGLGGILSRRWLTQINKNLDYAEYGGVPLLGVNGICVIAHGASSSKAIKNAVLESFQFAKEMMDHRVGGVLARNREMESQK